MNWKMIFIIYAKGKGEEKRELARNKITGVDDLQFFINHFYEEQREWRERGKMWEHEIIIVDEMGKELSMKKITEMMEKKGETMSLFQMTKTAIGEMITEGVG
ncbi:MAG: hypothetical protein ACTSYH_12180 [Candidatus Heimdallarchaeaceae archaeon]